MTKIQQEWIDALRSGKYRQGKGCLQSEEGDFCCLGVAHEVMGIPATRGWHAFLYEGEKFRPTKENRERLGLSIDQVTELTRLNDEGTTFVEIADYLEQLFKPKLNFLRSLFPTT